MENVSKVFYPAGRALLGTLFFISGVTKVTAFSYVSGWMASSGVPAADLLLAITIAIEVIGGLMLITGFRARLAAIVIALFLVPVTLVFHGFWSADAANFQNQLTQFLKNLAILGGMLLVIERGKIPAQAAAAVQSRFKTAR
jgi:putative oxidoreductase